MRAIGRLFVVVVALILPTLAAASTRYPDEAQNEFGGSQATTKPIQLYMDMHGTWRGNDYLVYCGPAFGGGWADARGLVTITSQFNRDDFLRPVTELERMNGGRTFSVLYNIRFRYIRSYNGLYHRRDDWVSPGQAQYRVTLRTTVAKKNIIVDVSELNGIQVGPALPRREKAADYRCRLKSGLVVDSLRRRRTYAQTPLR